jgi:hypothetical protein
MASRKTARVIDRLRVSVDAEDFALASAAHDDASLCGYVRLAWWLHVSRYEGALAMAIHKVIEVLSQSEKSWEDATQRAVKDAGKTVKNIRSIWVKNFEGVVKDNKIVEYRVNANITFEVK